MNLDSSKENKDVKPIVIELVEQMHHRSCGCKRECPRIRCCGQRRGGFSAPKRPGTTRTASGGCKCGGDVVKKMFITQKEKTFLKKLSRGGFHVWSRNAPPKMFRDLLEDEHQRNELEWDEKDAVCFVWDWTLFKKKVPISDLHKYAVMLDKELMGHLCLI